QAEAEVHSGATARKLVELGREVDRSKLEADEKDQPVRFTKSELTEYWYDYNHAVQTGGDSAAVKAEIDKLEKRLEGEQARSDAAKKHLGDVQNQLDGLTSKVDGLKEKLKNLLKKRDDFVEKAE